MTYNINMHEILTETNSKSPDWETDIQTRLYIVGLPVSREHETPDKFETIESLLKKARDTGWPVYINSAKADYEKLCPAGWDIVEKTGVRVKIIEVEENGRQNWLNNVADKIYQTVRQSNKPVVWLRMGSPFVGDIPVKRTLQKFELGELKILDTVSGPDTVAYTGEQELEVLRPLKRMHISAKEFLEMQNKDDLEQLGDLIVIRSLEGFYVDSKQRLSEAVLEKLASWGYSGNKLFIKGPDKNIGLTTVRDAGIVIDEIANSDHITVVFFRNRDILKPDTVWEYLKRLTKEDWLTCAESVAQNRRFVSHEYKSNCTEILKYFGINYLSIGELNYFWGECHKNGYIGDLIYKLSHGDFKDFYYMLNQPDKANSSVNLYTNFPIADPQYRCMV